MKRSHLAIAGVAILALALVLILRGRGGGGGGTPDPAAGRDRAGTTAGKPLPRGGGGAAEAEPTSRSLGIDPPDPDGALRLEGQVLDEHDQPVGGADVWITTQPPRSTTTEGDGTFAFDRLLPREYAVHARHGDAIGGPVMYALGPDALPVVIRLRDGATLRVKVAEEATGAPVPGAAVTLQEIGEPSATTGPDGTATFRGVGPGWTLVSARAPGYAPGQAVTTIGSSGASHDVTVSLRKGAPLSGRVVDEAGRPIGSALVTLRDAAAAMLQDRERVASGADGAFRFEVVPPGSYTVTARDAEHAPGLTELLTLDGVSERRDVEIVLAAGGTVRGRVVTPQRQPSPFASVQVAPRSFDQMGWQQGAARTVTAGADGRFEIKGLPREAIRVRAESDEAASAITDVDLAAAAVVDGLELVLDVTGLIAGIVVDAGGEPVPEAQVSAFADWAGSGGALQLEDLVFAGFTATTTDGGGAFRLTGLPDGAYRLWASRTSAQATMFVTEGTPARTGDTAVRIVLPAPGGLEGKLAFADGKAPELAVVQVGILPGTPTRDGAFAIRDLPPGRYDLRVRGPDFAELVRRDVEVQAGVVTDLGTLTLERGRVVAGRVVDGSGNPVEGARVVVGELLFSEGSTGGNQAIEEQLGLRSATTGRDGSFRIQGAPAKGGSAFAEHPDRGRSDAHPFAPGSDDVTVTLALRGFGSVAGTVTMAGEPVPNAQVMATSPASKGHLVVVTTGADGTFVIDKIPEGTHRLTASRMQNLQLRSGGADVTVVAGQRARAAIEIPLGTITLTVEVRGKAGAKVDFAQVFLFNGHVAAANAKDVTDRFLAGSAAGMAFWMGTPQSYPAFDKLVPGTYTVCTLPITGNPFTDTQLNARLQENLDKVMVYCAPREVAPSPDQQRFVHAVPAMTPLPEGS